MNEDGLTIALSPVQMAAILTSGTITTQATLTNRLWGGAKVLGGVLELLGAGVLCLTPEPTMATKAGDCWFNCRYDTYCVDSGWTI